MNVLSILYCVLFDISL